MTPNVSAGDKICHGATNRWRPDAFDQVAESAYKVGELVSAIASASSQQSRGVEQIDTAVNEMDQVVQNNAVAAEESASASEELSALADPMQAMVGEHVEMVPGGRPAASCPLRRPTALPYIKDGTLEDSKADKYLTFKLADEDCGISLLKVRAIIGMASIE